jgi:hypothetical protein
MRDSLGCHSIVTIGHALGIQKRCFDGVVSCILYGGLV